MSSFLFYREKMGITQAELAKELGVSQPAVAQWENGIRKPDIYMLKKIAYALKCTTDELLEEIKEEESA